MQYKIKKFISLYALEGCMAYIDNIIIYASNKDLYKLRLSRFFNACQQENLKLKLNKCHHFLIAKFILFGFQLDLQTHTITPEPCKVETILKIQPPTTKKQLKSFIGALSFFCSINSKSSGRFGSTSFNFWSKSNIYLVI